MEKKKYKILVFEKSNTTKENDRMKCINTMFTDIVDDKMDYYIHNESIYRVLMRCAIGEINGVDYRYLIVENINVYHEAQITTYANLIVENS